VPWRERTIVGTDYAPPGADPTAQSVAFLAEAQRAFPWAGLREEEVAVVHRGLVPGRDARRLWTRHRLLDHEAEDDLAGLVSIVGVKYTGARAVAEEVVDLVCARLGRGVVCRTAETPLPAAVLPDGPLADQARRAVREEMALHLGDVVLRRLELGAGGPPPPDTLEQVTRLVATERGWDARQLAQEKSTLAQAWARPPGPASTMDAALSGMR
jgi:glycerol-3-phosphate dehydrogenase